MDLGSLAAGACNFDASSAIPGTLPSDVVVVTPQAPGNFWTQQDLVYTAAMDNSTPSRPIVNICNFNGGTIDPPLTTWHFVVLR